MTDHADRPPVSGEPSKVKNLGFPRRERDHHFLDHIANPPVSGEPTCEERLSIVRQYVESNRDVWSDDPNDRLGMAYADIFQKVLNVIDTGHPMKEKPND